MGSSPDAQTASMIANLAATTGRSLEQWVALARSSGATKHGELVQWLKQKQGVTHGYANLIAHSTFKSDAAARITAGDDLVAEMFAGDRAALRPIFDAILRAVRDFGPDIEESPRKGYLSLRRSTQFASLHPSTKTRFDVGLKLKGIPAAGRLESAGSWNAMVTHRVRLASAGEVDAELIAWLRQAWTGA